MRTGEKNLRPTRLAPHVINECSDSIAIAKYLTWKQFIAAHDRFAAAEIRYHVAVFHPLDNAIYNIADAILVLLVLAIAFGVAHLLNDHLLGRLCGNASIFERL